jgi:crotonobetainyl-CoA:carnitine CoA-transferase CaiB-like acyl-CoA transferase
MVSISPFGQTGPYKDYKAPDIVAYAMGVHMYTWGDADRPPVRISHHSQAYLNAATEAAAGAMVALYHREMTGEGQQVDVSIRESLAHATWINTSWWDMVKIIQRRGRPGIRPDITVTARMPSLWPCQDGLVMWSYSGGILGNRISIPFVNWMDEEGMADDFLKGMDWTAFDPVKVTQEVADRLSAPTAKFFMTHTKAELLDAAVKHDVQFYFVATTKDILESVQLAARGFWVEVKHPELDTSITYPGAFVNASETPPRISRRAPLIGEHNQEVYEKELGFSREELMILKQAKVI